MSDDKKPVVSGDLSHEENAKPLCEKCQKISQSLIEEFANKMREFNFEVTQVLFRPLKECKSKEVKSNKSNLEA